MQAAELFVFKCGHVIWYNLLQFCILPALVTATSSDDISCGYLFLASTYTLLPAASIRHLERIPDCEKSSDL